MAEENKFEPSQEQTAPAPEKSRRRTRSGQKRRQQSATQYIVIMFAAVFALLLLTLLMERRENQEHIDDLESTSVSATQKLNNILAQNESLKDQVAQLEEQLQQMENENKNLTDTLRNLDSAKFAQQIAMDYFWQIDEAYVRGRYNLCRQLIQIMEAPPADNVEGGPAGDPMKAHLPRESVTNNERFSPYDRYMEIYEILY